MTNPAPGTPEADAELERRTLAMARADHARAVARIDARLAELGDDSTPPDDVDEPAALPWLELTDRKDGKGWHVLAPTTSPANPRVISGATQGYSHAIDVRRSISLTLAAALRFPGSAGTIAAYLLELDPTSTIAAGLMDALEADPANGGNQ